jgi:hypothetical protein
MGGALGHLSNLRPFIEGALAAGHQVSLVAKELHNVDAILGEYDIPLFQAPYLHRPITQRYANMMSFSQLVLQRFENAEELSLLTRAWDAIFAAVKPDIVIYDFAYSALVASYGKPWRKWLVGNGFMIPHTQTPYFGLFPNVSNTTENHDSLRDRGQNKNS